MTLVAWAPSQPLAKLVGTSILLAALPSWALSWPVSKVWMVLTTAAIPIFFICCLNGTEIFTGSFNLGGGGSNTILYNPNGGSALTTTFNASDDPQNSHHVTWAGGLTQVTLPISLLLGANRVQFGYTGAFQSMQDESWGINLATITSAKVTKVVVPEPSTLVLLVAGLLSIVALRRKVV
jgi:hypothetical protein